jgi:hypothetical protein
MRMTNKITTAALLVAPILLILSSITTVPGSAEATSDRCVSIQEDEFSTETSCAFGPDSKEIARGDKEQCKDLKQQGVIEKCSSSQTGFGENCNWYKPNKEEPIQDCAFE